MLTYLMGSWDVGVCREWLRGKGRSELYETASKEGSVFGEVGYWVTDVEAGLHFQSLLMS